MIEQHSSFRLYIIIILVFLNKLLLERKKKSEGGELCSVFLQGIKYKEKRMFN